MNIQDIVDYTALAILWIVIVIVNIVAKKIRPEESIWPYIVYSVSIGVLITIFAFLYRCA